MATVVGFGSLPRSCSVVDSLCVLQRYTAAGTWIRGHCDPTTEKHLKEEE